MKLRLVQGTVYGRHERIVTVSQKAKHGDNIHHFQIKGEGETTVVLYKTNHFFVASTGERYAVSQPNDFVTELILLPAQAVPQSHFGDEEEKQRYEDLLPQA
jgi:hypothetical protein